MISRHSHIYKVYFDDKLRDEKSVILFTYQIISLMSQIKNDTTWRYNPLSYAFIFRLEVACFSDNCFVITKNNFSCIEDIFFCHMHLYSGHRLRVFFRKLFRNNHKPGSLKQDTHGVCLLISRYYPIDKVYFDDKLRDLWEIVS